MIYLAFFAVIFILAARSPMVYITRVKDGDTVEALWRGKKVAIRLAGIDAPESDQPGGEAATKALKRLCLGRWVSLTIVNNHERHGRTLGELGDINRKLVRTGHAFAYMSKKYIADEQHAKSKRLGVHKLKTSKPWEWRKTRKKK